jgi:hypothetical protein
VPKIILSWHGILPTYSLLSFFNVLTTMKVANFS